ncbi:hypothetical protein IW148_000549 [Coemansia sp. RSA 1199]|nr:hypothetical protein IW148_000549 [Coemansia sp. RSA 1199]
MRTIRAHRVHQLLLPSSRRTLHTQDNSRLDKLSRTLTSVFQPTQPEPTNIDAQFTIVDSKHGSVVHAKLPPYSCVVTRVGQIIGHARGANVRATTNGSFAVAALRPLLGRSLFVQQVTTQDRGADVLVAPRHAGDSSVVGLAGTVDYFVRRGCVLAQTKFLNVSTWAGIGNAFHLLAFDRVSGRGAMVINTAGGLHRLVLNKDEEYFVDPRFVVAWSATLDVQPQSLPGKSTESSGVKDTKNGAGVQPVPFVASSPAVSNTVSAPLKSPAEPVQVAHKSTLRDVSKLGSRLLDYTVFPAGRIIANMLRAAAYASTSVVRSAAWATSKSVRTMAGVPDLYRVTGPGEIYVSSRLQPKPWTRITESIAAKSSQ